MFCNKALVLFCISLVALNVRVTATRKIHPYISREVLKSRLVLSVYGYFMMFVQTARCKSSAVGKKFWLCAVDIAFMNFPPTGQYFNKIVACSYMKNSFSIDLHRNFHGILTM